MSCPTALGRAFNIGSDRPVSIAELARWIIQRINPRLEIRFQTYTEAYGPDFEDCRRRVPDLTRIREALGYQPRYDLDRILEEVIEWRREFRI
jgi:UDP-glucose 4-epimerase